jgi:glycerol-3-phosphate cytidylyltransferase-like family protein
MHENKNKTPVINEGDRAFCIDNIKSVDGVMILEEIKDIASVLMQIKSYKPFTSNKVVCFKNSIRIYGANL